MIPLKLTIEGLYSYRSRQTIDFSNLTQSGLFGIFGGVGSGKSSILEAISFALYGQSQRLGGKDNRNYNMMNLKSDKLFIDFEFRSGSDNQYRFIVQGKRNSKKFEDVKTFERSAYRREDDQWIPIDPGCIGSITGLNYENFHRTIIIPQGKFQEFLQLSASERTTMLMELFNLSKYDLFDKISRLEARNNTNITRISSTMEGIGEVPPEKITELKTRREKLQLDVGTLNKDIETKEKVEKQLERLKNLTADIVARKSQLLALQCSETEMQQLEAKIKEYERINRTFRSDITQLADAEQNYTKSSGQLKSAIEQLRKYEDDYELELPVYDSLKQAYNKKDLLTRESDELEKLAETRKFEKTIQSLSVDAGELSKVVNDIEKLISSGREQQILKSRELENLQNSLPDIKKLADIKAWFREKNRILKDISDRQNNLNNNKAAIQDINVNIKAGMMGSGLFESLPEEVSLSELSVMVEARKSGFEEILNNYDAQRSALLLRQGLEQYAAELHEGQACPLCGSLNHPNILNPTDVATRLECLLAASNMLNGQLKICRQLERYLTMNQSSAEGLMKQNEGFSNELLALISEKQDHTKKFIWNDFDPQDEKKLVAAEDRYEQIHSAITQIQKELRETGEAIEENRKVLERKNKVAGNIRQEIASAGSRMELLISQIRLVNIQSMKDLSIEQLLNKSVEIRNHHDELVQKYSQAEKGIESLLSTISSLSGQISALKRTSDDFLNNLRNIRQMLELKLKEYGDLELGHVMNILGQDVDVEGGRNRIEKYNRDVESLRKYLEEKERELAGLIYDESAHLQLKEVIGEQKRAAEAMNREIGELQKEIATLEGNALRYAALKAELDEVQLRGKDIAELKYLFRGAGFVNYVSVIYLQNLCKAANERFYKLTRQQMGLELSADNSFNVRDYMNEGHLRSAKSLSGGQTFQASLSLALSLADSIHKLAGSQENFFFLDEGFGTLDKETLEVAFDTLKSLRKENRIVGVISHVEEMQTEIETYLKVTNDEEHGSVVRASWEG